MSLLDVVALAEFAKLQTVEPPYGRKRPLALSTTRAFYPELILLSYPTPGMCPASG